MTEKSQQMRPDFTGAAEIMAATLLHAGVAANYSPASIAAADLAVNALMGLEQATAAQRANYPELEWQLGCYLGELFCRRLGGAWHAGAPLGMPVTDPLCWHIIWPSGFMTCPFVYVSKRLENGARHSLFGQFDSCRKILRERGDIHDSGDTPQEWFEQGYIIAVNKKSPAQGVPFLKMALKLDPDHVESLHWLAQLCPDTDQGRIQAHQLYDRVITASPTHQPSRAAKVRLFLSAGDRDRAFTCLQQSLELLPEDPELNELMGDQHAARRDVPSAMAAYERGTKRGDSSRAWEGLGICRQATGDSDGAIVAWRQAADRDRNRPMPCCRLAQAEEKRGDKCSALQWYRTALERKPDEILASRLQSKIAELENDPELLTQQADKLANCGKTAEAVEIYEKIAAREPSNAKAWREAGVGYALLQQYERSLSCFDKALKADPDDMKTYDQKSVTFGRMGKFPLALDTLDQGLQRCMESAPLWSRRSYMLARMERWKEAITSANRALELDPSNGQPWLFLAEAERNMGRIDAAVASMDRHIAWIHPINFQKGISAMRLKWEMQNPARKLDPEMAREFQEYAFQHWQNRDADKSLKCFLAALESDPFSFELWNNYGSVLSSLGRYEDAVDCFERACRLYPGFEMFLQNKASALASLYRNEESLACREEILAISPQDERSLDERVRLLGVLERWELALSAADSYAAAYPGKAGARSRVSWALKGLGRFEEALAAIERAISIEPDDRQLWLGKSTILDDLGRKDEAFALQAEAFADEQFAEKYYQDGLKLLDALS